MSAPGKRTAAVVVVVALLAGVGLYINARLRAPAVDHAIELVPADARAYLHVFLKPSTTQRRALRDLLDKFPETDEDDEAQSFVIDLLREALARLEVDVDPDSVDWLGEEAAAYLPASSSLPTVILGIDDENEARVQLTNVLGDRLQGDLALAFVEDFAIIGPSSSVDASEQVSEEGSLASSSDYGDAVDRLDDDRIALFFTDGTTGPIRRVSAAILRVTPSSVIVDATTEGQAEDVGSISGFVVASITGVRGALSLEVPGAVRYLGTVLRATASLPEAEVVRSGRTITLTIGVPATTDIPAGLATAAEGRLGEDYEPEVVLDASGLPAGARKVLLGGRDGALTPVIDQFLTLDLGVREDDGYAFGRLVITFSDA